MMRFFERTRGSVSVFLILVLMPMYTCAYLAIDSARVKAAQAKVSGAAELAGNAALSDYDRTFKELYGLFVMSESKEEMEQNLVTYFSDTVDSRELSLGDTTLIRQLINNTVGVTFENTVNTGTKDFSIAYEAPVFEPEEMDAAIRSFMKYRAPYNWTRGIAEKIKAFTQAEEISRVMDDSKDYYKAVSDADAELRGVFNALKKAEGLEDEEETAKALSKVKKMLPSVKKELEKSAGKAEEWSGSVEALSDGEAKQLLRAEYGNSAAALSPAAIDDFSETLQRDIDALTDAVRQQKEAEEAMEAAEAEGATSVPVEVPEVNLQYTRDPFFLYLTSMYGRTASVDGTAASGKDAMEVIADTPLSVYTGNVTSVSIPELISEEVLRTVRESSFDEAVSLKGLAKLKEAAMNAYETEYITGMFGCLTTEETDTNLLGVPFGTKPVLKGEVEYILFGKDNMATNVALSVDLIFAVRLIMNSLYVYTNAGMRQSALAVAAAVAGWTGIGIPVAQNAILIAWATAESILDTASLCKGEAVPVYKTASTWTLSIQNLPMVAAKSATEYVSKGIDDVFEKIENAAVGKTEEAKDAALSYISKAGESAVESITSMIMTPVERTVTSLTSGFHVSVSRGDVESALMQAVNRIDASSAGVAKAKEMFTAYCLPELTDRIYTNLPALVTDDVSPAEQASEAIRGAVDNAYGTLYAKVQEVVDSVAGTAEGRIRDALGKASETAKKEAVGVIKEYTDSLAELTGETGDSPVSAASGLSMTYEEYLKLFLLVGFCTQQGKENMLKRCAVIMQINCENRTPGFLITGCFRSIRLYTEASVAAHTVSFEEAYHY